MSLQTPRDRIRCGRLVRHNCFTATAARWPIRFTIRSGVAAIVLLVAPALAAAADQWTNLAGTSTIEAEFIGLWEGKVILERPGGARVAVDKANLDAVSRLRVDELAAEQEKQRQERIDQLRSEAQTAEEIAPAEPAEPYQEWPESVGLEETVQHVAEQLQAGHPRVLWDALPPTYQQDVQSLVRQFADQADPEQYATVMRLGSQLVRVLQKQREFIFNYPKMAMLPPEARSVAEQVYTPVVGILAELYDPEALSLDALKATDLGTIIAQKDEAIAGYAATLIRMIPEDQNPLIALKSGEGLEVKMEGEDRATVNFTDTPGEARAEVFVRVEGRWMPEELVSDWKEQVAQAREELEKLPEQMAESRQQVSMLALTVGPALARLEDASTQQEFNAIVDSYVDLFLGMIPQNFGPPGVTGPPGSNSPPVVNGIDPGGQGPGGGGHDAQGPGGGHDAQGPGGGHDAQGPGGAHDAQGG